MKKRKKDPSRKLSKRAGLPPGSLVYVGPEKSDKVKVTVIVYSADSYKEIPYEQVNLQELVAQNHNKVWINIDGIHDNNAIEKIGTDFGIHTLTLEDILTTEQRPKIELYKNYNYSTLKMLGINVDKTEVNSEQISILHGQNWVLTFQEKEGDVFNPLRDRLKQSGSLLRTKASEYLFYRLLDTIVDNYFFVIEHYAEQLEDLEDRALVDDSNEILMQIQKLRKELISLKRSIIPLREALLSISKEHSVLNNSEITPFFKDLYDHVIQIIEMVNIQHEVLLSVKDLYFSGISNKMNRIMQVLTIISTIFIPLSFLAGLYGMNFDHMPELHWKYSYPVLLLVMFGISIGMLFFFKKRKWL